MRDVHLREVDLNLPTLLEERHVTRAAKRRLTDVHALRSMIASLRAALDDLYAVPASWLYVLRTQELGGQHWADIPNPESLRKGLDVDITSLGNQWEYFFDASGRSNHHHAERRTGKIAPGMGDALAEGDSRTRCGVKGFVAARDACRAFQNNEMLILNLMEVHGRAVTSVRDDLNDRICAVRVRRGYTDSATLSRPRL